MSHRMEWSRPLGLVASCVACVSLCASSVFAEAAIDSVKLLASDGAAGDRFGRATAVSDDVLVVGADLADANGVDSGAAYVFRWNGTVWVEEAKLVPADATAGEECGQRIDVDGNVVVVNGRLHDAMGYRSGAAWVFRWNGSVWTEEQKLVPSDGGALETFGDSLAVRGDTIVVGASQQYTSGPGAAYVFHWNGTSWVEQAKLTASDAAGNDEFGMAAALGGERAVIGAWRSDHNGFGSGSAYVFRRIGTGWVEEARLLPIDGESLDYFGNNVAIDGDRILVGASWDYVGGMKTGSAYVFQLGDGGWIQEAKLVPPDGQGGDEFGFTGLDIDGDLALIGSYRDNDLGSLSGSAYLFSRTGSTWTAIAKMTACDGTQDDRFGISAALRGGTAFVGAPAHQSTSRPGAVYAVDVSAFVPASCPGDTNGDGSVGVFDLWSVLISWGHGCPPPEPFSCGDADGDGEVGLGDLLVVLSHWGACP